jgi:hypothetical protein
MSATLPQAAITVNIAGQLRNVLGLSTVQEDLAQKFAQSFLSGTGAGKANMLWADSRSLATASNEDLDLAGGLTNSLGVSLTFTNLKAIAIRAHTTNTTSLTFSRPSSNGVPLFAAAGDAFVLTPGAIVVLTDPSAAGKAVTASTGDLLNVANAAGATAGYDIVIVGEV